MLPSSSGRQGHGLSYSTWTTGWSTRAHAQWALVPPVPGEQGLLRFLPTCLSLTRGGKASPACTLGAQLSRMSTKDIGSVSPLWEEVAGRLPLYLALPRSTPARMLAQPHGQPEDQRQSHTQWEQLMLDCRQLFLNHLLSALCGGKNTLAT